RLVVGRELVAGHLRQRLRQEAALDAAGQLQVALEALLGDGLLVQAGVLPGDGGLVGDAPGQLQSLLGELLAAVLGVELDDAERLAVGAADRHAHDGADAEVHYRLAQLDAVVAAGVVGEEGLGGVEAAADDAAAEAGVGLVLRPAGLDD